MSYYPLHLPCKVQIWLTSQKHNVSMLVNTIQSSWASSFVQRCSILLVWINKMREEQSPRQTEMLFPFPSQCSVYITTPTQPSQKLKHARQLISLEYLHSADSRSWRGPRRGTSSFFYAACLYKLKTNKQPTATKKKTHAHQILMFLFVSLHYGDCLHLGPAKLCLGHRYPLKRSPSTFQPVLVPPFLCWGVIAAWQKCIRGLPGCLWRTEHSKTRKKLPLYCIRGPNLRNPYTLAFTNISPDEEPFPFHNCGRQALTDVQVAQNLAWGSRHTNTALLSQEDVYNHPGLLWEGRAPTVVTMAQPHRKDPVLRSQQMGKGESQRLLRPLQRVLLKSNFGMMLMASLSSSEWLGRFLFKRASWNLQGRCSCLPLLLQNKPLYFMTLTESIGGSH